MVASLAERARALLSFIKMEFFFCWILKAFPTKLDWCWRRRIFRSDRIWEIARPICERPLLNWDSQVSCVQFQVFMKLSPSMFPISLGF